MKPVSKPVSTTLLLSIDLFGTFVFALQGASTAVQHELDLLGIMVLAFATALAGATVLVLGLQLKFRPAVASILGIVTCFTLRMVAVHQHWNLPKVLNR